MLVILVACKRFLQVHKNVIETHDYLHNARTVVGYNRAQLDRYTKSRTEVHA